MLTPQENCDGALEKESRLTETHTDIRQNPRPPSELNCRLYFPIGRGLEL
jgi:hypothetical protein